MKRERLAQNKGRMRLGEGAPSQECTRGCGVFQRSLAGRRGCREAWKGEGHSLRGHLAYSQKFFSTTAREDWVSHEKGLPRLTK